MVSYRQSPQPTLSPSERNTLMAYDRNTGRLIFRETKLVICSYYKQGFCRQGARKCRFAHGVAEAQKAEEFKRQLDYQNGDYFGKKVEVCKKVPQAVCVYEKKDSTFRHKTRPNFHDKFNSNKSNNSNLSENNVDNFSGARNNEVTGNQDLRRPSTPFSFGLELYRLWDNETGRRTNDHHDDCIEEKELKEVVKTHDDIAKSLFDEPSTCPSEATFSEEDH